MVEITDITQVNAWLADPKRQPATFLKLDLTGFSSDIGKICITDSIFVGCVLAADTAAQAAMQGAALITPRNRLDFDPLATQLYSVAGIYHGFDPSVPDSWSASFDHIAYLWFMDPARQVPRPIGFADTIAAPIYRAASTINGAEAVSLPGN